MRKFSLYSLMSAAALTLASCNADSPNQRASKEVNSAKSDNTEEALTGGLELAQPSLPNGVRADLIKIEIYKVGDCTDKKPNQAILPPDELVVPVETIDSQGENPDTCKLKKAHRKFHASNPIVPGKIHRIPNLPQGTYIISIKYIKLPSTGSTEGATLYVGRAITVVDENGEGKVEVVLKPFDSTRDGLEINVKIDDGETPAPSPSPAG
jgi:hypothetical protein